MILRQPSLGYLLCIGFYETLCQVSQGGRSVDSLGTGVAVDLLYG